MLGILYALLTIVAWGTWLSPSQNVAFKGQQIKTFYVAAVNLLIVSLISSTQGLFSQLRLDIFWLPFLGGLIWAVICLCAFTGTKHIGMAKAFGIWAPMNIIVSIIAGAIMFGEFVNTGMRNLLLLGVAVIIIIAGVLLIIFSKGGGKTGSDKRAFTLGLLGAVGAGILWGIYYIPIKMSQLSLWIAAFPLAVGIFVGSALLVALSRQSVALDSRMDYLRALATGALWSAGNYGMLLLVGELGAGKGYTLAQLSVVVNALMGIYVLKDPQPKTRAATLTLIGCVFATVGGILLGNIK